MMERRCDRCHAPIPKNVRLGSVRIVDLGFLLNDYRDQRSCDNVHFRDGDLCEVCARDFLIWLQYGQQAEVEE